MTKQRAPREDTSEVLPAIAAATASAKPVFAQALLFGIVGVTQLGVDWLAFVAFSYLGLAPVFANILGRLTGAGLGFVLNGRFTFGDSGKSSRLHIRSFSRFAILWGTMTALSTMLVMASVTAFGLEATWFIKPVIDALLAAAGFVASKYWIYR